MLVVSTSFERQLWGTNPTSAGQGPRGGGHEKGSLRESEDVIQELWASLEAYESFGHL